MEIIRQGADPAALPVQAECNRCGTIVKFLPVEAKYCSDQRDGDFYSIKCPVCPAIITQAVHSGCNGPG